MFKVCWDFASVCKTNIIWLFHEQNFTWKARSSWTWRFLHVTNSSSSNDWSHLPLIYWFIIRPLLLADPFSTQNMGYLICRHAGLRRTWRWMKTHLLMARTVPLHKNPFKKTLKIRRPKIVKERKWAVHSPMVFDGAQKGPFWSIHHRSWFPMKWNFQWNFLCCDMKTCINNVLSHSTFVTQWRASSNHMAQAISAKIQLVALASDFHCLSFAHKSLHQIAKLRNCWEHSDERFSIVESFCLFPWRSILFP